jgi:NAD(P)-dependent dehydrogenase (short-subunit alcohol dehydrogenase family)
VTSQAPGALAGQHAIVTGGGRGIGAAIAAALAGHGARLTLMGRDAGRLAEAAGRLGVPTFTTRVDVTDSVSVDAAFAAAADAHGPADILVNNAGAAESAPFAKLDRAHWDRMIAVNLTSVYTTTRAVLAGMVERRSGRVVNVASIAGVRGYAYVAAYCAAKHGVIGLTRALALETARTGVTVNAVCPGYTDTDMVAGAITTIRTKTGRSETEALAELTRFNPQGRLVRPEEVAGAVAWLCLPGSESITGQAILVAGGEVM